MSIDELVEQKVNARVAQVKDELKKELSKESAPDKLTDWIRGRQLMKHFNLTKTGMQSLRIKHDLTCSKPNGENGEIYYLKSEWLAMFQKGLLNHD